MLVQDIAGLYIPPHDFVLIEYRDSAPGIGEKMDRDWETKTRNILYKHDD